MERSSATAARACGSATRSPQIFSRILLTLAIQPPAVATAAATAVTWKPIQPGVELATIPPGPLNVVPIDPTRATLTAGIATEGKSAPKTAAAWCRNRVLKRPLDIQQAMHLEGGPEASLSIHVPGLDLDLCGSHETGFLEDESNREQWPLPNVIGVLRE